MNMELFRLINNLANKNAVLDKIMIFFSNDVPYIFMAAVLIVYIIGIIKDNERYRKMSVNTVAFTVINLIINLIIRCIFHVDRPFINNKVNLLVPHDAASSFPSNHATGTMSIALGLGEYNKIIETIMIILSVVVGFSRVFVGDHFPLDVIGAYIIVIISNYLYDLLLKNHIEKLYAKVEKTLILRIKFNKNTDKT